MTPSPATHGSDEVLRAPRGRKLQILNLLAGSLFAALTLMSILRGAGGWLDWTLVAIGVLWVIEALWNLRAPLLEISPDGVVYRSGFPMPARRIPRADLEGWNEQFGDLILAPRGSKPLTVGWSHLDESTRERIRNQLRALAPAGSPEVVKNP